MQKKIKKELNKLIQEAFAEDAPRGDITSNYFCQTKSKASAQIIAKQSGVLAGIEIAKACFLYADKNISFQILKKDSAQIKKATIVAKLQGELKAILLAERTALNFLQMLSGIATTTNNLVKKISKTKTIILDTRKTIPGLRELCKYAVRCGGGQNHRLNLSEMVLIKDNHLAKLNLVELKKRLSKIKKTKIEIEAENLKQVKDFLKLPVHSIMLDNMSLATMRTATKLRNKLNPKIKLEASGNINEKNILAVAKTGVDYISVGRLTHSFQAFDFSLKIKPK